MAKILHSRFEPNKLPPDWRDDSLHRAAVQASEDAKTPAVFPQDVLDYLLHLGYLLPRNGILFILSAREFVRQLVISSLPADAAADAIEVDNLQQRVEDLVSNSDFETAAELVHRKRIIQDRMLSLVPHTITRAEINEALFHDGIEPSVLADQANNAM